MHACSCTHATSLRSGTPLAMSKVTLTQENLQVPVKSSFDLEWFWQDTHLKIKSWRKEWYWSIYQSPKEREPTSKTHYIHILGCKNIEGWLRNFTVLKVFICLNLPWENCHFFPTSFYGLMPFWWQIKILKRKTLSLVSKPS